MMAKRKIARPGRPRKVVPAKKAMYAVVLPRQPRRWDVLVFEPEQA